MIAGERWPMVKALVARALEQPPGMREPWVDGQDVADEVRRDAKALLQAHARAERFLERAALAPTPLASQPVREPARPAVRPSADAGETIGAYRVIRSIGEGATTTVLLAARADSAYDMRVAIKLVRARPADARLADRLGEERRLLATLDHPGIARLLDGGVTSDGLPYVVMEYVEGIPIDVYCRTRTLSVQARLQLVRQVCEAVHHAHRNLIVHSDIRAGNILVTAAGVPRLLEVGIAKALGSDRPRTVPGAGAITPETASPEQLRGEPITVATDVWGLGGLLYTLLAGRTPFAYAASAAALTRAICDEDPPPAGKLAPALGISQDVERIIRKALAKRPQDRYDNAAALSADIGRFLEARPIEAAPGSMPYRARLFAWRHRVGAALATVGILAATAGIAAAIWQARAADRQRAAAERRLADVRQLTSTIIFDLDDAIADLPGSASARGLLVERTRRHLDRLSGEVAGDTQSQRELAEAYERLAAVQGGRADKNLGDTAGARASLDRALTLRQHVATAPTARPPDQVALAVAWHARAQLESDPVETQRLVGSGLAALERLAPADRSRDDAIQARANLYWTAATARVAAKEPELARPLYQRAIGDFEQLVRAARPEKAAKASRTLSTVAQHFGAMLWEMGDRAAATALYQRAVTLDEARLATQPDHPTWRADLAGSLESLAFTELENGEPAGAVSHYEASLALRKAALAANPEDADARAAVARVERTLAEARDARRDAVAATAKQ